MEVGVAISAIQDLTVLKKRRAKVFVQLRGEAGVEAVSLPPFLRV